MTSSRARVSAPLAVGPRALGEAAAGLPSLTALASSFADGWSNPGGARLLAGGLVEPAAHQRAAALEARVPGVAALSSGVVGLGSDEMASRWCAVE
eukprot:8001731-Alexandrium_andersonii.AAC.1